MIPATNWPRPTPNMVYLVQVNPDTANKILDILKRNVLFVGVLQQRMPTADKHTPVCNPKINKADDYKHAC
jgi:hypothetical protein